MAAWLNAARAKGVSPEQALALIGLGLVKGLADQGDGAGDWSWVEGEAGAGADLAALRQRLELTQLALNTGAPLSTAEVAALLGARPGGAVVERAGLRARRLGRNLWRLSRAEGTEERSGFSDGFRRRL